MPTRSVPRRESTESRFDQGGHAVEYAAEAEGELGVHIVPVVVQGASGDLGTALPRYEQQLRLFVHRNQQLARDVVDKLVPTTRRQAGMQLAMMRMLPYLPGKH
ncbi:hypothetical protein [Nocardia sp. NPDC051750]|uniref:hypothetical protein n=1 Tax=Nocardia sp. NPDC051750 TaxID=3364325 RepID=UPI00378B3255